MNKLKLLRPYFAPVHKWNYDRYGVVENDFNFQVLLNKLLIEEYTELVLADSIEEQLDAIGDILFVICGGLTKTKEYGCIYKVDDYSPNVSICSPYLDIVINAANIITDVNSGFFFACSCLEEVIKSNNTKAVDKVSSDKKANLNKGSDFVPPNFENLIKEYKLNEWANLYSKDLLRDFYV